VTILGALVVAVAAAGYASSATGRTTDTVITFDDLAPSTTVTTQYAGKGITFDQDAQGRPDPIGRLLIESVGSGEAHSGTQVGNIQTGQNEFPSGDLWGHFTVPRQHVSLYVGQDARQLNVRFTLDAYDVAHNLLPGVTSTVTVPGTQTTETLLSVTAPSAEIYSFHVSSNSNFAIVDDLSFDSISAPPPPDFGLAVSDANREVSLQAGGTAKTTVGLARNATSTGRIRFTVSGLPTGVTASVDPNPDSTTGNSPVTVSFSASDDAPAVSEQQVTVTAQPQDATAGSSARSVQVLLTVQGTYKLIATGLEVTQGTQYLQIPTPGPDPTATVPYTGVKLTSWKPTFVRLFLDAQRAPVGGVDVTGQLFGFDEDGRPLPGSPLGGSTKAMDIGAPRLNPNQRASGMDTITFGPLPASWTQGGVKRFRAVISPPPSPLAGSTPPAYVECETNDCKQTLALDVGGIRFYQFFGGIGITVVNLHVDGLPDPPDNPYVYMPLARQMSPVNLLPEGPEATLDITDIWNGTNNPLLPTPRGWSNDDRNDKAEDVISLLQEWNEDNSAGGSALMGVANRDKDGHDLGMETDGPVGSGDEPVMVVNFNRPYTSVAHELGHAFGRQHASAGCGGGDNGQKAEDWPDPNGHLDGIGLDIEPGFVSPQPLPAGELYDFMSYCAGDGNSWISPKGWDEVMSWAAPYTSSSADRASEQNASQQSSGNSMRVIAIGDAKGTRITSIQPGALDPGDKKLPMTTLHLLVKNRAGKVVAETGLRGSVGGHVDGPGGRPFTMLLGQVPAGANVQTVAITDGRKIVAKETRPADKLAVRLLAPTAHTRLGGSKRIRIRWHASAAVKLRWLRATVEYSADAGRTWKPVWLGANSGGVTLGSSVFQYSRRARIRVLLSDGFNQAQSESGPLAAAGTRPRVAILSPAAHAAYTAAETVTLNGRALDDAYHPVPAGRLVWFAGAKRLGTGATISVRAKTLGSGRVVVSLRARDGRGRVGSAGVQITVGN